MRTPVLASTCWMRWSTIEKAFEYRRASSRVMLSIKLAVSAGSPCSSLPSPDVSVGA